jgi:hypothetical protein
MKEELEKALVDYYNELRPLFQSIPPCYSITIPYAKRKKERKHKEYWDVVTFCSRKTRFKGINRLSPMEFITFRSTKYMDRKRWAINVNPLYCSHPQELNEDLFPLLHEMVHVKQGILGSNNLHLDYEKFSDMDSLKIKKLCNQLNPEKRNKDGDDVILLLFLLAKNILNDENFLQMVIGNREIDDTDPTGWLVKQMYIWNPNKSKIL